MKYTLGSGMAMDPGGVVPEQASLDDLPVLTVTFATAISDDADDALAHARRDPRDGAGAVPGDPYVVCRVRRVVEDPRP